MKPQIFISEVRKHQILTDTSDSDLRRITGWSVSTMRRRFDKPDTITLGEADRIKNFLGMN